MSGGLPDNEKIYDEEISPVLAQIGRRCRELGFSFVARVEWEPGDSGNTGFLAPNASIKQKLADWAARADGNVDALLLAVERHARKSGHSSVYLKALGVPENPDRS